MLISECAMESVLPPSRHLSVMPEEVLAALGPALTGAVLDCTLGGAGHTRRLLDLYPQISVTGLDRDLRAIERARPLRERYAPRLSLVHGAFHDLPAVVAGARFNAVIADLGLSTDQLFEGRGFSFHDEQALDMRMDPASGVPASTILNDYPQHELVAILRQGGVGNEAKSIVRAILRARPILHARQLATIVADATPAAVRARSSVHPATVVFQALRIAVNNEFDELRHLLDVLPQLVLPGARVAVISFHSLEDAIVARTFRDWSSRGEWSATMPSAVTMRKVRGKLLTPKAILPSADEREVNPSARSARLRVFEFLAEQ